MFNIEEEPTFTQTVTVVSPDSSTGDFTASFLALDIDVYASFDLATGEGTKDFLVATLRGVEDVIGNDGLPVADGPELRQKLLAKAWIRTALVRAYHEGVGRAARGN